MKNTFNKTIFNKLSVTKLAGVKKFITLEVYEGFVKLCLVQINEPFYKITGSSNINSVKLIDSKTVKFSAGTQRGIDEIEEILNSFINKNEAAEAHILSL